MRRRQSHKFIRERNNSPCEGTRAGLVVDPAFITTAEGPESQGNDQSFPSHQSRAGEHRPLLEQTQKTYKI